MGRRTYPHHVRSSEHHPLHQKILLSTASGFPFGYSLDASSLLALASAFLLWLASPVLRWTWGKLVSGVPFSWDLPHSRCHSHAPVFPDRPSFSRGSWFPGRSFKVLDQGCASCCISWSVSTACPHTPGIVCPLIQGQQVREKSLPWGASVVWHWGWLAHLLLPFSWCQWHGLALRG